MKGSGKSEGHKGWENRQAGDTKESAGRVVESDTMSEECGSLGMWRTRKTAPAAKIADPNTGHTKINAMNYEKFVKDDTTGPVKLVKIDVVDGFSIIRDGSSRVRSERRANVWRRQMGRRMWLRR